jgi:hypothetical protein
MTTDAVTADLSEPPPLHCYRHPDRETWVRCGRCDQPICMGCAMQGPVGLRCKTCGKPARDALASLRPSQVAIALAVAGGLGAAVAYFSVQFSYLMIVIGFFAGTFVAEGFDRTIGIKRGPRIVGLAITGILLGGIVGGGIGLAGAWRELVAFAETAEAAGLPDYPLDLFLLDNAPTVLISLVAMVVGAFARLR